MSSTTIEQFGATSLVESGNNYFLSPNGGAAIELSYGGAPVVDGQFGQIAPIGAEQTASGYLVAWKVPGVDQYSVWVTDGNGNYLSNTLTSVSGTSPALQSIETSFHQDLNGDGLIGLSPPPSPTVIEQFGAINLVESGGNYFLYPNGGSAIELSYGGAPVVDGQFDQFGGHWVPIGAEQTASGYEVAWKIAGADQYTVWYTDNSGNYLSSAFNSASGTSAALESFEPSFQQDLNGDGVIGPVVDASPPQFVYEGTDANGVRLYDLTWNILGEHPFAVRVLAPDHPSTNYAHSFVFALPVEGGLAQSNWGSGLDELRQLNVQNQYDATIIEPIFPIDPWYADNPIDPTIDFETFTATLLPAWVKSNFATSGTEENLLIGFSKSGYGALDLLFKHPSVFDGAAAWDFPADMAAYDTFGSSSSGDYGSDANFQANYRMTASFVNTWKAPFTTDDRIWLSEGSVFPIQVAASDALLTSQGVLDTFLTTQTGDAHNWYGGWVSDAVAGLYGLGNTTIPTLTAVTETPSTGDLNAGKTVTITLNTSEAVTVTGTPTLMLSDGGTASYDAAKSSPTSLVFDYTVAASNSDVASLAVTAVNLPGGATIQDGGGNNASLLLSGLSQSGPKIDTTIPTLTAVTETPNTGDLNAGKTVTITLNTSEAVTVTGTPTLMLSDGGTASYDVAKSSPTSLVFDYTVAASNSDVAS